MIKLLELKQNELCEKENRNSCETEELQQQPHLFVGKRIKHVWFDDDERVDKEYLGKIMSIKDGIFQVNIIHI